MSFPLDPPLINPDGIEVFIPFEDWKVGMSVFVPTLNAKKLEWQLRPYLRALGWKVKFVHRIEAGRLGVRIWRLL